MGGKNADVPWDDFDSAAYVASNYAVLRDDDRELLCRTRDFFSAVCDGAQHRGIDVGSGPNLYPALTMLPFCHTVSFWEKSRANVDWLKDHTGESSADWKQAWSVLAEHDSYRGIDDPGRLLAQRARIEHGDVFRLPERSWDMGTMFFVAESITSDLAECRQAVRSFVRALCRRAPFAVAFMRRSRGYHVGALELPAVALDEHDIKQLLDELAGDLSIDTVNAWPPVRSGYEGMVLALGRAR